MSPRSRITSDGQAVPGALLVVNGALLVVNGTLLVVHGVHLAVNCALLVVPSALLVFNVLLVVTGALLVVDDALLVVNGALLLVNGALLDVDGALLVVVGVLLVVSGALLVVGPWCVVLVGWAVLVSTRGCGSSDGQALFGPLPLWWSVGSLLVLVDCGSERCLFPTRGRSPDGQAQFGLCVVVPSCQVLCVVLHGKAPVPKSLAARGCGGGAGGGHRLE